MGRDKARNLPPERAPRVEVRIDDLDHGGRGVGRVDGKVVFVDGALPGELVRARLERTSRRFDEAVVEARFEDAASRLEPFCPAFGRCGGCTLQHLAPAAQVEQRERLVADQLARAVGAAPERWLPPLTGPDRGYRARARLTVRHVRGRGVLIGFRERGGRHVADTDVCGVLDPRLEGLLVPLKQAIASLSRPDRVSGLTLCTGDGDTVVVLHCRGAPTDDDVGRLRTFQQEHGVVVEVHGPDTAGPVDPALPADPWYGLPAEGIELRFGALDFFQANPVVNRALVARAMEWLAPAPGERVLDLYCGIGNFSLPAARRGATVTGIEGDAGLVERAAANAEANGLAAQTAFHRADLSRAPLSRWLGDDEPTAVLLDPPRAGAPEAVEALVSHHPGRVVFVSCDPATLARDVGRLVAAGRYRLRAGGIADMFPHTGHVEALVMLEAA